MDRSVQKTVATFFSGSDTKTFSKGEILTMGGEEVKSVTYLLEGVVEQYDITPEGNKVTVNVFKPPAFFPMSSAINKTPNNYFFAALTDLSVKQADPDKTVTFLKENPAVTFDLLGRVYKGTDAVLRRLVLASSGVAAARLIFELIIEAYRFGTPKNGEVRVRIKQSTLAARTGLARETVSRELHKLEREGLVRLGKEGMHVSISELEAKLDVTI